MNGSRLSTKQQKLEKKNQKTSGAEKHNNLMKKISKRGSKANLNRQKNESANVNTDPLK